MKAKTAVNVKTKKSSPVKNRIGAVVLATVAAGSLFWVTTGKGKPFQVPAYVVARVIDGDTFETAEKQLIRLSAADAPELEYCGGR